MLGDPLDRVDAEGILAGLKAFQRPGGQIGCLPVCSEEDVRFAYCAVAIYEILKHKLWSEAPPSFDSDKLTSYLKSWISYDGGFGWMPGAESHGGITYWTLGIFRILNRMHEIDEFQDRILEWLVSRQRTEMNGIHGRLNKIPDTWYSFWNAGSLAMIDSEYPTKFIHKESVTEFVEDCQKYGGYAKYPFSDYPDILHTFYSMAFLSMMGGQKQQIDPVLGIPGMKW